MSVNKPGKTQITLWPLRIQPSLLFILLCFSLLMPPSIRSQELQGIAAVVNDDVISMYDLYARMKMVLLSLEIEDSPEVREELMPQIIS
mgnify:CR=1 FL=1